MSSSRGLRSAWTAAHRGYPARYPLVQAPNAPLLVFVLAAAVERLADGTTADLAFWVSRAALAVWAVDEVARGSNAFRRVLGVLGLALVVKGVADR